MEGRDRSHRLTPGASSDSRAIADRWQAGKLSRLTPGAFSARHGNGYSPSGKLRSPRTHPEEPLRQDDRGHGMIFRSFHGSLRLVVHRYFSLPKTRVQIWNLPDEGHRLSLGTQLLGCE